ncbi:hypothetical protein EOA34_24430, partial [Mesorhizobium sp. M4B.F.Ca.ET.013.02.1.1]
SSCASPRCTLHPRSSEHAAVLGSVKAQALRWPRKTRPALTAKGYEHFVEAWRPRPPKERARGRLSPARLE